MHSTTPPQYHLDLRDRHVTSALSEERRHRMLAHQAVRNRRRCSTRLRWAETLERAAAAVRRAAPCSPQADTTS